MVAGVAKVFTVVLLLAGGVAGIGSGSGLAVSTVTGSLAAGVAAVGGSIGVGVVTGVGTDWATIGTGWASEPRENGLELPPEVGADSGGNDCGDGQDEPQVGAPAFGRLFGGKDVAHRRSSRAVARQGFVARRVAPFAAAGVDLAARGLCVDPVDTAARSASTDSMWSERSGSGETPDDGCRGE